MTHSAGHPIDFTARRRILVAEEIVHEAIHRTDWLWEPRAEKLNRLVARLEGSARQGDAASIAFLGIIDEAAHQAAAYAGQVAPLLLEAAARIEALGLEDARLLAPGPIDTRAALPSLTQVPLGTRIVPTLTGIITATTTAAHEAAASVFGVAPGPREVARRITQSFGTAPAKARVIARTELLHAYRAAALERYAAMPAVSGWYWLAALDGNTCPVCWGMNGTVHPLEEPFGSHPNCRCTPVPIVAGRALPVSGEDQFAALTIGQQRGILGPSRFAAYQDGASLASMIATRQNPVYGLTRQLVPVRALAQRAA